MKHCLLILAAACLACVGCFDNHQRPADVVTITSLDALAQTNRAEVVRLSLRGAPRPVTDADLEGLSDTQLRQLDLSELNLEKVPAKVWSLKGLTSFWFVRNKLAAIPDEVAQLPALTYLNLDGNAITAVPDEIRGQIVKASVVLVKDKVGDEALVKEIQTYVKTHTAPYKYPRIVEFLPELPKTISGKIRRVELRGRH